MEGDQFGWHGELVLDMSNTVPSHASPLIAPSILGLNGIALNRHDGGVSVNLTLNW